MRVVLHNPHINGVVGKSVLDVFLRTQSFQKYSYVLPYFKKKQKKVYVYLDGGSSFPLYLKKFIPDVFEIYLWATFNKINPFRLMVIKDINSLKKEDILLSFSLGNFDKKIESTTTYRNAPCIKIVHLTHFVQNTSLIADNLDKFGVNFLLAENNLRKNSSYFKKYFNFYKKNVYTLPFVFQARFKVIVPFNKRVNKCLATGTLITINEFSMWKSTFKDFVDFYHVKTIHPMRAEILKNKKTISNLIDSYISNFWETKRKESESQTSIYQKWKARIYNAVFATRRDYYKFDIVQKYNEHKMFVVPEEINDLPSIGFVEGMACGSAYIGQVNSMYGDIGLKPGIHYIGYNGSLEDLKKKITYYQSHPKELEKIANTGTQFVRKNFSSIKVAEKFYQDLENLSKKYKKNSPNTKNINNWCSFVS